MASLNENDDVPMLPISDSSSRTRAITSRTRSLSLSNPTSSIDGFDSSTVVLGYTGPLRTQKRPPLVQMSGPLTSTRRPEPLFLPPPPNGSSDSVGVSSQPERYPSFAALQHKNSDEEFVLKHANLLRSGQLGMCNDPYCTTCPSYYNRKAAQIPTSRVSAIFDSTVWFDFLLHSHKISLRIKKMLLRQSLFLYLASSIMLCMMMLKVGLGDLLPLLIDTYLES